MTTHKSATAAAASHSDLHPYPTDLPPGIITMVVNALRGQGLDSMEVSHAVWHAAGYGLSRWDTHPVVGGAAPLSNEEAAKILESTLPRGSEGPATAIGGIEALPWGMLVPLLLELIKLYFRK